MVDYLPDHSVVFFGHGPRIDPDAFELICEFPAPEVFAWSYKAPAELEHFCRANSVPLTFVEDGFLRSVGLGADRTRPHSLVFDRKGMHFDRSRPSELEHLLMTADLQADGSTLATAELVEKLIVSRGLSKYVFPLARGRISDLQLGGFRERVLVLGQVEDDLSIQYGANDVLTGNGLVQLARAENPRAAILYRPHPESLAFPKPHYSKPADVASISTILGPEYPIGDCIAAADTVYTITSLAGFEAVLHRKRVVTLGGPFYASWGFTEDRAPVVRRTRQRTAREVLAAAYCIYPRYFDPDSGRPSEVNAAIYSLMAT